MKSFLEEYGFAILAAIVVILLIAMCSPVGNMIKTQVLNTIEKFASTADKKIASSDTDEMSANIIGGTLYVSSPSSTDQFTVVLHGTKAGSPHIINLDDPNDGVDKAVKSWNLNVGEFDAGSTYYAEVTNVGTSVVFTSNIVSVTEGGGTSNPSYEIIDGDKDGKHYHNDALFTGTCDGKDYVDGVEKVVITAHKGGTLTLGSYQYLVMTEPDANNQALVVMKTNKSTAKFNNSNSDGNAYNGSNIQTLMEDYWNNSVTELGVSQDAIVAKDITIGTYKLYTIEPNGGYFAKGTRLSSFNGQTYDSKYYIIQTKSDTLENQHVYPLDVVDVVNYLGKNNVHYNAVWEMLGSFSDGKVSRDNIRLRSADAEYSSLAWAVGTTGGDMNKQLIAATEDFVRPAFVVDLSKIS